jgi:L-aminopeptidase/D-esterase-like protein
VTLPAGFAVGHATDPVALTGCTVVVPPAGVVAAAEVRGGGPGTRETDLLSPAAAAREVQALVLTGGSALGLHTADAVARVLLAQGRGYVTRLGHVIPLVPAAVVYDLGLGAPEPPDADAGPRALAAATDDPARGTVGAGTGCVVGKVLGAEHATKGGVGLATQTVGSARLTALAVVNAFGDVLGEDGAVLAGPFADGAYRSTVELLRTGAAAPPPAGAREATTLVAVLTDAALDKTGAWLVARAASQGIARAVDPSATSVDGDAAFCLAAGTARPEPLALVAVTAHVVAAAIRDGVRSATGVPGCPSVGERGAG